MKTSGPAFLLGWVLFLVAFLMSVWRGRALTRRIRFRELVRGPRPSDAAEAAVWWWSRLAGTAWLLMMVLTLYLLVST